MAGTLQRSVESQAGGEASINLLDLPAGRYELRVHGDGDFPLPYDIVAEVGAVDGRTRIVDFGRSAEDTGLNRMLGSIRTDDFFGGTVLDFMFGNGHDEGDPDRLYDRNGRLFAARDGGVAGEEWKEYALSTDAVWYYSGTNLNDVITVDFVTEPGFSIRAGI